MLNWMFDSGDAAWATVAFRAALAAAGSFVLAIVLGARLIAWLECRFREPNISPSARIVEFHRGKARTPTMGGLFIVAAIIGSLVACGDLSNPNVLLALLLTVGLATLGAIDDVTKIVSGRRGISARGKLAGQLAIASLVACLWYRMQSATPQGVDLVIPGTGLTLPIGMWAVPFAVLTIVGSSNAVNLTDGLDGLAGGCLVFATLGMGLVAYVVGHVELAAYLHVPNIGSVGELAILAGGITGSLLGFLWFNCHPAQVFMGDTGSLPLGGLLGWIAVATRQELLLAIVGGVFVAEAVSVLAQIVSYRLRGRRVLLCAPLHHHFQFLGWPESRIVVRFWIASALCTIVGLASMKFTTAPGNGAMAKHRHPFSLSLRERAGVMETQYKLIQRSQDTHNVD